MKSKIYNFLYLSMLLLCGWSICCQSTRFSRFYEVTLAEYTAIKRVIVWSNPLSYLLLLPDNLRCRQMELVLQLAHDALDDHLLLFEAVYSGARNVKTMVATFISFIFSNKLN